MRKLISIVLILLQSSSHSVIIGMGFSAKYTALRPLASQSSGLKFNNTKYAQCKQDRKLNTEPVDLFDLFHAIKGGNAELKGVVFDNDGVIVNTEPIYFKVKKPLYEEIIFFEYKKICFRKYTKEDDTYTTGGTFHQGCFNLLKRLKIEDCIFSLPYYIDKQKQPKEYNILNNEQKRVMDMIKDFTDLRVKNFREYIQTYPEEVQISPGIKEKITLLRSLDIRVGVASSGESTLFLLKFLKLDKNFDAIVTGLDVGDKSEHLNKTILSKPNPDLFQECAYRMGINPKDCIGIEDSPIGASAVNSSGMVCIGFDPEGVNNKALYDKGADIVIKSFKQLSIKEIPKINNLTPVVNQCYGRDKRAGYILASA